eukprot:CAMPEP_0177644256 /NCGR_PEP_ID=MMETSP0447-20121125/8587_1 /TAXON_ID=0 /ORGANISM="Stygamoeba regulata, Strain BSH-02190019" /LENGTH=354 /DNA_ID=CAMNT_0019146597 /DNA_START=232 /DNA_END=1292 /DNA_ORIENTATION=-
MDEESVLLLWEYATRAAPWAGILLLLLLAWHFCPLVVVPHGKVAVAERWGRCTRTLEGGPHLLGPFEVLHTFDWSCEAESTNGRTRALRLAGSFMPTTCQELDIPAFDSLTKDGLRASVNGTLLWHVCDARKAAYEVTNLLGFVAQAVRQAVRSVTACSCADDMFGKDEQFGSDVTRAANERLASVGIATANFLVQDVRFDEAIMKAREASFAELKKEEMRRRLAAATHARNIAEIENLRTEARAKQNVESEQQQHAIALAFAQRRADAELQGIAQQADTAALRERQKAWHQAGACAADLVQLECAREWRAAMQAATAAASRVVYMPTHYSDAILRRGQVLPHAPPLAPPDVAR